MKEDPTIQPCPGANMEPEVQDVEARMHNNQKTPVC